MNAKRILTEIADKFPIIRNLLFLSYHCNFILRARIARLLYSANWFNGILISKKGDTCYILGSGPSINLLGPSDFKIIRKNTSIGLNTFILHTFLADIYMVEESGDDRVNSTLINIFEMKRRENNSFIILCAWRTYRYVKKHTMLFGANVMLFSVLPYITNRLSTIRNLFEKEIKLKSEKRDYFTTFGASASIERALFIAIKNRFKNIVLVGIDLNLGGHFWSVETSNVNRACVDYSGLHSIFNVHNGKHPTTDPKRKKFPVVLTIPLLNECLKERGQQIFVYHDSSLLTEYGVKVYRGGYSSPKSEIK